MQEKIFADKIKKCVERNVENAFDAFCFRCISLSTLAIGTLYRQYSITQKFVAVFMRKLIWKFDLKIIFSYKNTIKTIKNKAIFASKNNIFSRKYNRT